MTPMHQTSATRYENSADGSINHVASDYRDSTAEANTFYMNASANANTDFIESDRDSIIDNNAGSIVSLPTLSNFEDTSAIEETHNNPKPKKKDSIASSSSARRILRELEEIAEERSSIYSAGLKGDNLYEWECVILGQEDTVYEGGVFFLDMHLSPEYPFKPPKVAFRTRIYHCNINSRGNICIDILRDNWSPALTISTLLLSICSLMSDCNPADPLVYSIAIQYLQNREEHDRTARHWTEKYADVLKDKGDLNVPIRRTKSSAFSVLATRKSLIILAGIFIISLTAMCYGHMICPELNESHRIKIPRFLYRFPIPLFLTWFCAALGATLCYCLSNLFGGRLIRDFWPKKINE
uniref:E2 ubiquitin-conjugating enzyme n=1 Tax=Glossina brevipalpis TaxID=37001 RepID=A0A1A9W9S5_9MUSC